MSESTEFSDTVGDSEESSTAGSSKGSRRGRQRKEAVEESESVVNELKKLCLPFHCWLFVCLITLPFCEQEEFLSITDVP